MPIELLWLLLPWSLAFVFLGRLRACPPTPEQAPERLDEIRVSVIVPARNEVARLPPLLASLREQDYVNHELIVVDDNSTDGTGELARAAGATTLTLTELADGWLGKPRACWVGAQQASGELLVFLDADTELAPSGLRRLVATHARYGGLVSVQPYHRMRQAYERLSVFFSIIMMGSIRSFTLAGEHVKPNGSFGPCMLCSRADYVRTGGHHLVRAEIVDDVALAREMNRHGVPSHNFIGEGVISFRMYPHGVRDLAEGWTKNFGRGAIATDPVLLLMLTAWISGSIAVLDAIRGWPADGLSNWVVAGLAAYCAYVVQLWWLLRRLGNFGWLTALTYPVSLAFFVAVFLRSLSLTLTRQSVRWKGRVIPLRSSR
ncbi:glycosyltransferase [Thiobaca trueperi]|uniref:4,4'-diaponeurosporenoate glycosyltransferase n=1 Tax=Thiobaca trueperi TaxID=127458 RepID=A0A4R3MSM2_9GAMM|nr:glycosyltransferase [Thiobaca trueperi]TCT19264.1 4,4'-diaponeurosporenoate glycosyltransferase [Thiobaca trueperi]